MKTFHVYILASPTRRLYVGLTSDLARRVYEHKNGLVPGFTARYNITRLVHFEETNSARAAIAREKQIKGWLRNRKIALIESRNPAWEDLAEGWVEGKSKPEADSSLRSE